MCRHNKWSQVLRPTHFSKSSVDYQSKNCWLAVSSPLVQARRIKWAKEKSQKNVRPIKDWLLTRLDLWWYSFAGCYLCMAVATVFLGVPVETGLQGLAAQRTYLFSIHCCIFYTHPRAAKIYLVVNTILTMSLQEPHEIFPVFRNAQQGNRMQEDSHWLMHCCTPSIVLQHEIPRELLWL